MFTLNALSGITSAQLDMTAALAPLGIGLLSLLAVSASVIVWGAVRSRLYDSVVEIAPVAAPLQEQKMAA